MIKQVKTTVNKEEGAHVANITKKVSITLKNLTTTLVVPRGEVGTGR